MTFASLPAIYIAALALVAPIARNFPLSVREHVVYMCTKLCIHVHMYEARVYVVGVQLYTIAEKYELCAEGRKGELVFPVEKFRASSAS